MIVKPVALPAVGSWSASVALLGLDMSGSVSFGVSKAESIYDQFDLYGAMSNPSGGEPNLTKLGSFTAAGGNLSQGLAKIARSWPYLIVQRTAGDTAGTFFVSGNEAPSTTEVVLALPAVGAFSAVASLLPLSASEVRIGLSANQQANDAFDVFLSQDATVVDETGCFYAGQIRGGGAPFGNSLVVSGWPYVLCRRVSGTTGGFGSMLRVFGPLAPVGGGSAGVVLNNGNSFGVPFVIGPLDGQPATIQAINANMTLQATGIGNLGLVAPIIQAYEEVVEADAAVTTTKAVLPTHATVFDFTLTGSTTFTFGTPRAAAYQVSSTITIRLKQGGAGSYTVTWPGSVSWGDAGAPTLSTAVGKVDVVAFNTTDGGVTWQGFVGGTGF